MKALPRLSWPTASLRAYLVVAILLATVPIATLMSHQIFEQVDAQRERMREEMQRSVAVLAQSVSRELTSSVDALNILSYSGEIQQGQVGRFEQALLTRPLLRPSWSGIYLLAANGEKLFDTARPVVRTREMPAARLDAVVPSPNNRVVVSDLHFDRDEGAFVTTVEVPVVIDRQPRFVLGARIRASLWQQLVDNSGVTAPGVASIFDSEHRIIARNLSPRQTVGLQLTAANQALMASRPSGTASMTLFEGGYSYSAWDTVPLSRWGVAVGTPAAPINAVHQRAIAVALATAAGCLLLGVLLALWVARRMTRPLHQLSRNDLSQPLESIAVREILLLRDALVAARMHDETVRELIRSKRDLLQKKADEFETLFSACPIGLAFAADPECQSVLHNTAMDALCGSASERTTGVVRMLRAGRPLPPEEQPLLRAAAHGESTSGVELEILIAGRPTAFIIATAVPLLDGEGRPRGAIGAAVDITERKAAEARLIDAERRLRESQSLVDLAQESGHVGFFSYQVDEDLLAWTPGQAKLFAMDENEEALDTLGKWRERIPEAEWRRIERTLKRASGRLREMETLDYSVELPSGETRWLSSRVRLIYSGGARLQQIVGVSVDLTEQKNAEQERAALIGREQAARREAEAANRSKDEFLAMLGHELRNPLSAIASGIEVLDRVSGEAEVARNARRIIRRQTRHLAHMMEDLLDVARVISGQVVMARHSLDLAALVQRVLATLNITGEGDEHEIAVDLNEVWIDADPTRIEQVVSNLINNAIKYTPAGGRIEICVGSDDGAAIFQVKDNGIGIAPDLLPRVFDLFVQGERPLDRRAGGLGVGLTLTRRLIELHGGTICAVDANPGTIMSVRLPATDTPAIPLPTKTVHDARRRRIAVIEDNEDVLEALRSILELDGQTVWTATDGISGLALILETDPDVAIVDLGLPGLTGFEVATRSRAGGYAGRMIALSGYGQQNDVQRALGAGFDMHFLKPVDSAELLSAIASE